MKGAFFVIFAVVVLLVATAGTASAKGICSGVEGGAKGLCIAFCEILDCDANPSASRSACKAIDKEFVSLVKSPMPCRCPCYEPAFLATAADWQEDTIQCRRTDDGGVTLSDATSVAQTTVMGSSRVCLGSFQNGDIHIDIFPKDIKRIEYMTCGAVIAAVASEIVPDERNYCNRP